jgi:hypothetical protein
MSREEDQAQQAGEKYADDQINSDPFMDWVWEQLVEASRMDPSEVLPLETKADAKRIAHNMLQQLEWDAKRDLDGRDIARLIGIDIAEREDVRAFFDGFERSTSTSRDWLAENILSMIREIGGGGVGEARRSARRPTHGRATRLTVQPRFGDLVEVASFEEASELLQREIAEHGMGYHEWYDRQSVGAIRRGSRVVAKVSYNGRVWAPSGQEIIGGAGVEEAGGGGASERRQPRSRRRR